MKKAMPHERGALLLPDVSCRAGSIAEYSGDDTDGWTTPLDLAATWGTQRNYKSCLRDAFDTAESSGLYDRALGKQTVQALLQGSGLK